MVLNKLSLAALVALTLASCQPAGQTPATAAEKPLATINGVPIGKTLLDTVIKSRSNKGSSDDLTVQQRADLVDMIVGAEAVAQQATRDKLDQKPEIAAELALSRLQILETAAANAFFKTHEPTDAELRSEYEDQVRAMPKLQYQVRHVLVKTEAEASDIIRKVKAGAKLASFAKQSLDPGSKDTGGMLGWLTPTDRLVKEFTDAMVALKKGEMTQTPVKSQFGYHVIAVEDTRDNVPPPFDSVKDNLKQSVQGKKFKAYTDGLVKTAKVVKTP